MNDPAENLAVCHIENERALLGSVLVNPDNFANVVKLVSTGDFIRADHKTIWRSMVKLHDQGSPIDAALVRAEAVRLNGASPQDTGRLIANLMDGMMRGTNIEHYAQRVHANSNTRGVITQLDAVKRAKLKGSPLAPDLIEGLIDALRSHDETKTCASMLGTELGKLEIVPPVQLVRGLIDEGNRIILFGEPESGKSFWALALLVHLAGGFTFAEKWEIPKPQKCAFLFFEDSLLPGGQFPPRVAWRYQSILKGLRGQHGKAKADVAEANLLLWVGTRDDQGKGYAAAREHGSKLTAIDSWTIVATETDENTRIPIQRDYDRIHAALGREAFSMVDHTKKPQGERAGTDADSLFGSVRKRGVADVILKLVAEEAPNGDVGVVVKRVKGRDGLDLPPGGRYMAWTGLPANEQIPQHRPVPLILRHEQDRCAPQKLGSLATEKKEAKWARLENTLRGVAGKKIPKAEAAVYADVSLKTINRWLDDETSPFKETPDGWLTGHGL